MSVAQTPEALRLNLPGALDTAAAGSLFTQLSAARGRPVLLDASEVRRVGGLCLQVLLAARSTWATDGFDLSITDPSPDFLDGVTLMGCADLADLTPVQE